MATNGQRKPTSILIADDHQMFRQGLRLLLEDELKVSEIVEADDFDTALDRAASMKNVDLILVDLKMPGMAGGASIRSVRQACPSAKVVVVSGFTGRDEILDALGAGAHGYVPKRLSIEELTAALRLVLNGGVYVPPDIATVPAESGEDSVDLPMPAAKPPADTDLSRLTPRQRDVLRELAQGRSTKEIARSLDLAEGTVKIHLAAIFRLLGVRNRTEAAIAAAKFGI